MSEAVAPPPPSQEIPIIQRPEQAGSAAPLPPSVETAGIPTSAAAGAEEVDNHSAAERTVKIAMEGLKSGDTRLALEILAGRRRVESLQREKQQLIRRARSGQISQQEASHRIAGVDAGIIEIDNHIKNAQIKLEKLAANERNPQARATLMDLQIHTLRQRQQQMMSYRSQLTALDTPNEAELNQVTTIINEISARLGSEDAPGLLAARQTVTLDGKPIPDRMVALARQIQGRELTPQEAGTPLKVITGALEEAAINPAQRRKLSEAMKGAGFGSINKFLTPENFARGKSLKVAGQIATVSLLVLLFAAMKSLQEK